MSGVFCEFGTNGVVSISMVEKICGDEKRENILRRAMDDDFWQNFGEIGAGREIYEATRRELEKRRQEKWAGFGTMGMENQGTDFPSFGMMEFFPVATEEQTSSEKQLLLREWINNGILGSPSKKVKYLEGEIKRVDREVEQKRKKEDDVFWGTTKRIDLLGWGDRFNPIKFTKDILARKGK